jgi:formate dehydrogenase major subunit
MQKDSTYTKPDGDGGREVTFSTDPGDFHYMRINVPCQAACPAQTNIPAYIRALFEKQYDRSYEINRMVNVLPGVLGRICSRPCEDLCRHGEDELGDPVKICHIKRAASDYKETGHVFTEQLFAPLGKKICIIGAGPAGLAAAHDLAVIGFEIEIIEAFDEPGGMLLYGIPEFRLPRDILRKEIESILRLGVKLKTGVEVGKDVTVDELLENSDAVLVAAGCYIAKELGVEGEGLPGVIPGLDFCIDINKGKKPEIGKRVLVLGAGFTAFDCARFAMRLGAEQVDICIRRTEQDIQVTKDEIEEAKLEGVNIRGLMMPKKLVGEEKVEGVMFLRSRLSGERPDGGRSVEPIEGSEFTVPADTVIVAIGQESAPIGGPGATNDKGILSADINTYKTSEAKLYATGDFVTGPTTVIDAIAQGRAAAEKIAEDLTGKQFREWAVRIEEAQITDRQREWDFIPHQPMPTVKPAEARFDPPNREVETGFSDDVAHEESKRCYLCYLHYEIDIDRCIYCRYCIDVAPRDCIKMVTEVLTNDIGAVTGYVETNNWKEINAVVIDNSRCIRCGYCVMVCPVDCISVSKVEKVERMLQKDIR